MTDDEYDPNPNDEYLPTEWVPRDAVEPNDWNPNQMDDEARTRLRHSLLDNGWTMPIVVHAEERYIIDGEQRWTVAGIADIQERDDLTPPDVPAGYVPVHGVTMEQGQAKMATIQHNRARGDVDLDSMRTFLDQLDDRVDLGEIESRIGVDEEEASKILDEVTAREIGEDEEFGHPWEPVERHEKTEEEMDEERTASLRRAIEAAKDGDLTDEERDDAESVARNSKRMNFVITDEELELVDKVLGRENRAQSFINLLRFVMENRYLGSARPGMEQEERNARYDRYDDLLEDDPVTS